MNNKEKIRGGGATLTFDKQCGTAGRTSQVVLGLTDVLARVLGLSILHCQAAQAGVKLYRDPFTREDLHACFVPCDLGLGLRSNQAFHAEEEIIKCMLLFKFLFLI